VEQNFTPYSGGASFLAGPTERTKKLWGELEHLIHKECEKGE
jgi:formate C-acetyltransferase